MDVSIYESYVDIDSEKDGVVLEDVMTRGDSTPFAFQLDAWFDLEGSYRAPDEDLSGDIRYGTLRFTSCQIADRGQQMGEPLLIYVSGKLENLLIDMKLGGVQLPNDVGVEPVDFQMPAYVICDEPFGSSALCNAIEAQCIGGRSPN